jgi:hypothetical protein
VEASCCVALWILREVNNMLATPKNVEYAIKFFERHMKEDVLRYGERQAIHIALELLRKEQNRTEKEC